MEFYDFELLSTHDHIVLFDRFGRVSDFLQEFNAIVARELNAIRGKSGTFSTQTRKERSGMKRLRGPPPTRLVPLPLSCTDSGHDFQTGPSQTGPLFLPPALALSASSCSWVSRRSRPMRYVPLPSIGRMRISS